jgi:hypothetical protein
MVPLVMIMAEIAFLRHCRIKPKHGKHYKNSQVQFSCGHRLDPEQQSAHDAKCGTSRSGICLPDRKVSSHAHVSA